MSSSIGIGALVLAVSCSSSAAILVSGYDALIVGRSKGREIQTNKEFDDYLGKGNRPLFVQAILVFITDTDHRWHRHDVSLVTHPSPFVSMHGRLRGHRILLPAHLIDRPLDIRDVHCLLTIERKSPIIVVVDIRKWNACRVLEWIIIIHFI